MMTFTNKKFFFFLNFEILNSYILQRKKKKNFVLFRWEANYNFPGEYSWRENVQIQNTQMGREREFSSFEDKNTNN